VDKLLHREDSPISVALVDKWLDISANGVAKRKVDDF
jgi:hypothetical protein